MVTAPAEVPGASNPYLGTIGNFATPPPFCVTPVESLTLKADRYALQSIGRVWMPEHAIARCHRRPARRDVPVEVWYAPAPGDRAGSACYGQIQTCRSAWADPVCCGKISDHRRGELRHALDVHRGAGGAVYLLTYTARHQNGTPLYELLSGLLRAVRVMRSPKGFAALRRRYGHVGSVRAVEVTVGGNGWHPHFHELWFGESCELADLAAEIQTRWLAALGHEGLDGLRAIAADVREASMTVDDYVTKYGHERSWDVDAELAKGISKRGRGENLTPFDLLRRGLVAGDKTEILAEARAYYREYVLATKGKCSLQWSRGLKDAMGVRELSDAEIAGGVDDLSVLLGRIGRAEWTRIMAADARIAVLHAAATGEWETVRAVIDGLPEVKDINRWAAAFARVKEVAR